MPTPGWAPSLLDAPLGGRSLPPPLVSVKGFLTLNRISLGRFLYFWVSAVDNKNQTLNRKILNRKELMGLGQARETSRCTFTWVQQPPGWVWWQTPGRAGTGGQAPPEGALPVGTFVPHPITAVQGLPLQK